MTIAIATGGGIPVRGTLLMDTLAPSDYTFNGQRFLKYGVIETDQTKFSIEIWTLKRFCPIGELKPTPKGETHISRTHRYDAGYGAKSKGNYFGSMYSVTNTKLPHIMSTDGGATWKEAGFGYSGTASDKVYTKLTDIVPNYIPNAQHRVFALQLKNGGTRLTNFNFVYSDDGFETQEKFSFGNQGDHATHLSAGTYKDENGIPHPRMVAGCEKRQWLYSKDDSGLTWGYALIGNKTDIYVDLVDSEYSNLAFGKHNNRWVGVGIQNNRNNTTYDLHSADGVVWSTPDAIQDATTVTIANRTVVYSPVTKLFYMFADRQSHYRVWTSSSGGKFKMLQDVVSLTSGDRIYGIKHMKVLSNGKFIGSMIDRGNERSRIVASDDNGMTWYIVPIVLGNNPIDPNNGPDGITSYITDDIDMDKAFAYGITGVLDMDNVNFAGGYETLAVGAVNWQNEQNRRTYVRIS